MSFSQFIASLQFSIAGNNLGFYAAVAMTPEGAIADMNKAILESITTPGYDGEIERTVNFQFADFMFTTYQDYPDGNSLLNDIANATQCVGQVCTLAVGFAETSRIWPNVICKDVTHKVIPGGMFGWGASSFSAKTLALTWKLKLTETSQ